MSRVALFATGGGGLRESTANGQGSREHLLLAFLGETLIQGFHRGSEAVHAPQFALHDPFLTTMERLALAIACGGACGRHSGEMLRR